MTKIESNLTHCASEVTHVLEVALESPSIVDDIQNVDKTLLQSFMTLKTQFGLDISHAGSSVNQDSNAREGHDGFSDEYACVNSCDDQGQAAIDLQGDGEDNIDFVYRMISELVEREIELKGFWDEHKMPKGSNGAKHSPELLYPSNDDNFVEE
ncbi:hypothetical protein L7F22_017676, partial [Adiantum nelumboides]|nr:hypothetical protein [Adiantum nelumboides]